MIEIENVHREYHLGETVVRALRGVSLKVTKGDFVFIIGPSGSGKSTMLDIMGALEHPTKGKVRFNGKDLSHLDDYDLSMLRRHKIGFVFQSFNLVPTLDALDNVLIPLLPEGIEEEERQRAIDLLTELGLKTRMHHTPNKLSGGERQRVAIARALINFPEIVLADEPTGEVDSVTGEEIMNSMRKMNKEHNTTFVIVTHDTEYIKKGDIIYKIHDGKIKERTKVQRDLA